jgi:prevent-host-death family protein
LNVLVEGRMKQVNIHHAKTHLSSLLEEVSAGEEITIAKAGKPLARLVPLTAARRTRKPGFLKGRIRIAADFDAPLPDALLDAFEGKS